MRRRQMAQGLARRAEVVLLAADGLQNKEIAARIGKDANTVGKWRRCFAETIRKTFEETPTDAIHWSLRSMARAPGHAPSTVHRIWQAFGPQPYRSEAFKLSTDPFFVEKLQDIVDQIAQELAGDHAGHFGLQPDEDELERTVNTDKQLTFAFLGAHLRKVDVTITDRISLELRSDGLIPNIRQAADAQSSRSGAAGTGGAKMTV